MILLISTCADRLSESEFVSPVKDLVGDCIIKHYSKVSSHDLLSCSKIIICGTALMDFDYLKSDWSWFSSFTKPVLGICAGYQVIAQALNCELISKSMIGVFSKHYFVTSKLIKSGNVKVVELIDEFIIHFVSGNFIACAFHPEVINPEVITEFLRS